jgi:acyl-CoA reductase-like NAD-dependent aldehyde dehydrogenase
VKDNMKIAREEIFGPVMSVFKFDSNEEVLQRANESEYGLGAGVVTEDLDEMHWFVNHLKCGTVYCNCYNVLQKTLPFGGYKNSGIGRELGEEGLNNYLENKTVIIKNTNV